VRRSDSTALRRRDHRYGKAAARSHGLKALRQFLDGAGLVMQSARRMPAIASTRSYARLAGTRAHSHPMNSRGAPDGPASYDGKIIL